MKKKMCPVMGCTNELREPMVMNALSRRDNKTYICSDHGVAEAMEDFVKSQHKGGDTHEAIKHR